MLKFKNSYLIAILVIVVCFFYIYKKMPMTVRDESINQLKKKLDDETKKENFYESDYNMKFFEQRDSSIFPGMAQDKNRYGMGTRIRRKKNNRYY